MHFISDFTTAAMTEVFDTMLNLKVELVKTCAGADMPPNRVNGVVSSIGLAGKINGTVYINYTPRMACSAVERMIGNTPASDADPDVIDVIGEIANMVVGTIKRHSSMRGYDGWLSLPMVLRGENIEVEGKGAPIAIFSLFRIPAFNEEIGVRVYVKLEN